MAARKRKPGKRALANRKRRLAEIRKMSATEKRKLYPMRKLTRKELEELGDSPGAPPRRGPERFKDLRQRMDVIEVEGGYSRGEAYKIPIFASHDFWYSAMQYHEGQWDPLYAVASRYFAKARRGFKRAGPVIIEVSHSEFHAVCDYARQIRRSRAPKGASARAFLKRYKKFC